MNRFKWWAMGVFSSALVCVSLAQNFYSNKSFGDLELRILALYSPTILLSVAGVLTSICCKGNKIKPWFETILILLNLIVWIIIGIATLVGSSTLTQFNDIAIDSTDDQFNIGEPNIYFFSFGSLFNAVYLASSWFKQYVLRDENSLTTTQWSMLTASGFLVMATGISLLDEASCNREEGNYFSCERTYISIVVGLISGVAGLSLVPCRTAPLKCQAELAFILLVTWAIAIAVLTFGAGPAVYVNTMYLGIFLSFFLALNIFTTTLYADSVLEASPYSQVEFGRTESQRDNDVLGAAGFLDMAYANIRRVSTFDDDPRHNDESTAILFESVGGSLSSLDYNVTTPRGENERAFNRKVIVGKRHFSRIEIWFWLLVESSVCFAVFKGQVKTLTFQLSILISCIGWFTSSIKNNFAYYAEGVLILTCVILGILGLIEVTRFFKNDTTDGEGTLVTMTANQMVMSYGSFFTSLYLITNWSSASVTTTDWVFLSAASFTIFGVLFITNDQVFAPCNWRAEFETCGELQMVAVLASGSAGISFVMAFISFPACGKLGPLLHASIGTVLLTLWGVGSYFIVFATDGVGSEVGPTFFACWGSLFFCVDITTTNLLLLFKKQKDEEEIDFVSSLQDENDIFGDDEANTNEGVHETVSDCQTGDENMLSIITEDFALDDNSDDYDKEKDQLFERITSNT